LGRELWETPVGRVITGMEHAEQFYSYGDMPPWGHGPLQNKIHNQGRAYIDTEFPLIDSFDSCTVQRSVTATGTNSRAAEVEAAVADAAQEAEQAAADAHGGIRAAPLEEEEVEHRELGAGGTDADLSGSAIRTPISLSSMKLAAEQMRTDFRHGRDGGDATATDWSEAALVLACIVLGCGVAGWITTKLFGRPKKNGKTS
jgi:hypothetical protein